MRYSLPWSLIYESAVSLYSDSDVGSKNYEYLFQLYFLLSFFSLAICDGQKEGVSGNGRETSRKPFLIVEISRCILNYNGVKSPTSWWDGAKFF